MADSEERRYVDRIRAISFKQSKDNGADFITRRWVAEFIGRSEQFVKENWNRDPYECRMSKERIGHGGNTLNEHEKRIVRLSAGKQKKSPRTLAKYITARGDGPGPSHMTVYRYMKSLAFKPFHVIKKPFKTAQHCENRLWFCDYLRLWEEDDFTHLACSDEFYIWLFQAPNNKNDRVWARTVREITDDERYRPLVAHSQCIGIFICFTARRMMWVVKDNGQSWTAAYFMDTILQQHLIPFLREPDNVIDVDQVTLLHDKAPCFKALAVQQLLRDNNVDFFGNAQWPGNSPDINACEHVGAIIKDRVESAMHNQRGPNRYRIQTLHNVLNDILLNLEFDVDLFDALLRSYPRRLAAVQAARGGHTDY